MSREKKATSGARAAERAFAPLTDAALDAMQKLFEPYIMSPRAEQDPATSAHRGSTGSAASPASASAPGGATSSAGNVFRLPVNAIMADPALHARVRRDERTVAEYQVAMSQGDVFPPVVVFQEGTTYWLADGFMRLQAATKARLAVWVEVRPGCRREAMLFAASANAGHGLPRTSADKRRVVQMLLDDPEWRQWSDARIARVCRVSDKTVAKVRRATAPHPGNSGVSQRRYCTKHGTAAVMRLPAAPAPAKSSSALFLGGTPSPTTAPRRAADAVPAWVEAEPSGANPAVPGEGSQTGAAETLDALLRLGGQLRGLGPDVLRHDVAVSRLDEASDEIRRLLELLQSARGQE